MAVREVDGKVLFLRKLVPGGSDRSFGIHVAQMAGMPRPVIERAKKVLAHLEQEPTAVKQLRPEVPAELSNVVARMLAKQPEDR